MSERRPTRKVLSVILVYVVVASSFTSPLVFAGPVVAGNVAGNTSGNDGQTVVWGTHHGDEERTGYVRTAAPPANNPYRAWKAVQNDRITSSPAVANDAVYVGSDTKDRLYALNPTDGTKRWAFTANAPVQSPTLSEGTIYVGDGSGSLHAVDAADGSQVWRRSVGNQVVGSPTVARDDVYVTVANDGQSHLLRLDTDDGQVRWSTTVGNDVASESALGAFALLSSDGQVHAFDRTAGNVEWSTTLDESGGLTMPVYGTNTVYVVDRNPTADDGTVYALSIVDGTVEWSHDLSVEPVGPPALANGTVYVAASDAGSNALYRLDAETGAMSSTSTSSDLRTAPVVAEKTVFVGTAEGVLGANATDGTTRYAHAIADDGPPGVASTPAVGNEAVYLGLDRTNDSVYKLAGDDFEYPPNAAFDASQAVKGESTTFDASGSSDFDGSIASYEWDVDGDESFEKVGETVTHTFDAVGNEQVTLRVVDDDGNADTTSETVAVREPADLGVTDYAVSAANVGIGDTVTVEATVENTGGVAGRQQVALYDNGSLEDTVYVTVDAGNTRTVSLSATFDEIGNHEVTVESLAPTYVEVSDGTPPPAPDWVSTDDNDDEEWDAYLRWDGVSDLGTGVDHYEVKVGEGSWQNVGGTTSTYAHSNRSGTFEASVRAVDEEGNVGPAASTTFKIDVTPPTAPNVSVPDGWVNNDNAWVSIQNSTEEHSGFKFYDVEVDTQQWKYPEQPNVTLSLASMDLDTGRHYVEVRPTDELWNYGPWRRATIYVDETDPTVSISTSNGSGTSTLEVDVTDAHSGITPENVSIKVDGSAVGNVSAEGDSVVYTGDLTPGTHYVAVNATDNVDNSVSDIWEVTVNASDDGGDSGDGNDGGNGGGDGDDAPGGGGGGGGGGAVRAPPVRVDVTDRSNEGVRAEVTSARADAPASVSLGGLESGQASFDAVAVTPTTEESQPRFFLDVAAASSPDVASPPSDRTLSYLRVTPEYIEDSELAALTFEFRVPTGAAARDSVTMYRYHDGSWQRLPTEFVGERDGAYAFRATADGASVFAVGATPATTTTTAETTTVTTTNATTTETTATPDANATATTATTQQNAAFTTVGETPTEDASGSTPGFGLVAAVVALAVAALAARRRE